MLVWYFGNYAQLIAEIAFSKYCSQALIEKDEKAKIIHSKCQVFWDGFFLIFFSQFKLNYKKD